MDFLSSLYSLVSPSRKRKASDTVDVDMRTPAKRVNNQNSDDDAKEKSVNMNGSLKKSPEKKRKTGIIVHKKTPAKPLAKTPIKNSPVKKPTLRKNDGKKAGASSNESSQDESPATDVVAPKKTPAKAPIKSSPIKKPAAQKKDVKKTGKAAAAAKESSEDESSETEDDEKSEEEYRPSKAKAQLRQSPRTAAVVSSPGTSPTIAAMEEATGDKKKKHVAKIKATRPKPPNRNPYTEEEDNAIVKYIVDTNSYNDLKGNVVWKDAEADEASGVKRTWQSLKEHFRKAIMSKLKEKRLNPPYTSVTKEELEKIKEGYLNPVSNRGKKFVERKDGTVPYRDLLKAAEKKKPSRNAKNEESDESDVSDGNSSESPVAGPSNGKAKGKIYKSGKRSPVSKKLSGSAADLNGHDSESESESGDDEEATKESKRKTKYVIRTISGEERPDVLSGEDSSQRTSLSNGSPAKKSKTAPPNQWTDQEDEILLSILSKWTKKTSDLKPKGNQMWETIAGTGKINREAQGIRERFLKRILPKIDSYDIAIDATERILAISGLSADEKANVLKKAKKRAALIKI